MDPEKVRALYRLIARMREAGRTDRQINRILRQNRDIPFNSVYAFETQANAMGIEQPATDDLAAPEPVSRLESGARGARQGMSLGFDDEAAGVVGGLANVVAGGGSFSEGQRNAQANVRARTEQAQRQNPGTFLAGEVAGALGPTSAAMRPAGLLKRSVAGAGEAGAYGAGTADPDPSAPVGQRLGQRAGSAAMHAPFGLVGAGGVGVARRGGRLARALTPRGRRARRPFSQGLEAADEVLTTTGAGGRTPSMRSEQGQQAFEFGRQLFDRPPSEIGSTVQAARFHRQAVQDGLAEEIADRVRQIGSPRKVVEYLASDPVRNRLRHATADEAGYQAFMDVVDKAVKLEGDAALSQAGGEILRNSFVFGTGAGFSSALQRIF